MKKSNIAVSNLPARVNFLHSFFKRRNVILISAYLLAALFLYAAYNKLSIYSKFIDQLQDSPITTGFENILAWMVPAVEIVVSALLIMKRTRILGLWSAFILMSLFTIYVFMIPVFFSSNIPCSCGGIISTFSWTVHFWFNSGFTLLAALAITLHNKIPKN